MGELLAGIGIVVLGLVLLSHEVHALGLFMLAFGAFFAWRGYRRFRVTLASTDQFRSAVDHSEEVWTRASRGEGPDQIAQAFEAQYGIAPKQTLGYIAFQGLRILGRGQNAEDTQDLLGWFTHHRAESLPAPDEVLADLDPRRNIYAVANEVVRHPAAGATGKPLKGSLVATRTHLYFLPLEHAESFVEGAAKEAAINALPEILGVVSLTSTMVDAVQAELQAWNAPKIVGELQHRLAVPGGIAVSWRKMVGVRKDAVQGTAADKVFLALGYGDPDAPAELRLSRGKGFDEAWVDDWIDVVRGAAILEGRLLAV